jgi:CubicO group peptidase (beta-lactamase class C family)
MRRAFTLALLLSGLTSIGLTCEDPLAARIGLAENLLRELEGSPFYNLEERMAFHGIPGVSVAVIRDGEIDWAKGYGTTSLDGGHAIDAATLFQAGSISKPVAAFAALQLVDAGILTLDSDVNEVLTSWQVPENQFTQLAAVTLRHLLSHAAATTVEGLLGYNAAAPLPTLIQVLDGEHPANNVPIIVQRVPGSSYSYSGGGFVIVQQLIEDATAQPMAVVVRENLFEPAGMQASTIEQPLPGPRHPEAATGHLLGTVPITWGWNTHPELGAAGLWSTPSDVARFAIALQESVVGAPGAPLSQSLAELMLTSSARAFVMGLGVFLYGPHEVGLFYHAGENLGYTSWMQVSAQRGYGAVVMMNSSLAGDPTKCEGECALMEEIMGSLALVYDWPCARWGVGVSSNCFE